jgi:uncharacterized damage-inducible protein DinB
MKRVLSLDTLLDYTDWERQKWFSVLRQRGDSVLEISAGPHGDGRFTSIGEIIRHIVSAETRYMQRLLNRPLTDTASLPASNANDLARQGEESRRELRALLETFPTDQWDISREFVLMDITLRATPRKIITHILLHEIRHWAQIATLLRLQGIRDDFHDFLFGPDRSVRT